ncbi:hypothetical protein PIB30_073732 [Stylosanthes scabra]|uniref:Uncharacterized protein n=1 Tax=Stylosanthes scabra TaxID=79078 RepID=A0ABU6ZNA4_9FABA|nr:hypothetical protein [Stylosanthes scabra]
MIVGEQFKALSKLKIPELKRRRCTETETPNSSEQHQQRRGDAPWAYDDSFASEENKWNNGVVLKVLGHVVISAEKMEGKKTAKTASLLSYGTSHTPRWPRLCQLLPVTLHVIHFRNV